MFDAIINRLVGLEMTGDVDKLPRVNSNLIDGFTQVPISWKQTLGPAAAR